jgi:HSP20 family protein
VPERDLFANFDRMRREMDEIFGDVLERSGLARARAGFSPSVDVYYCGDPPTAVVKAELAGIDIAELGLEIRGRELVISGHRSIGDPEQRVYQQLEIEHGPFRRVIPLGAEVDAERARASYEDGVLRVELPLVRAEQRSRTVPVEAPRSSEEGP